MQNGRLKFKNDPNIITVANPANTMRHERVYLPNVADAMQNQRFYLHHAG
jgi:hypothetical protein